MRIGGLDTDWLVSSAMRFSSTTPLSTSCLASSRTALHGLLLKRPLPPPNM